MAVLNMLGRCTQMVLFILLCFGFGKILELKYLQIKLLFSWISGSSVKYADAFLKWKKSILLIMMYTNIRVKKT
jgi:hypothetical protein